MSSPQPIWDFWVRFGHWLIEKLKRIDTHTTFAIVLSGLVVFRLAQGFVGPKYARFWCFR